MRLPLILSLLALSLLPGCVVAGAVGGAVLGQEMVDNNVYLAKINSDANLTWAQTKVSLSNASTKPIDVDNDLRRAVAEVDGTDVTATVETYDLNKSILRIEAKKYGFSQGQTAKLVFDRILNDLDTRN